jgi:hypothetical protein
MAEDYWEPARLIPTSGIRGSDDAERRATSALLAVLCSVKEFGAAIVRPLGAPAGQIDTFIEVPFEAGDRTVHPDGVIQTGRAGRTWTALVEVKTGSSALRRDQLETYLDVARENDFDVVLTISNEIAPAPGVHPVDVDKRKLKKVALHHLSWSEVATIAIQQREHRGVSDPDQAWILGELIRYLVHPKSGALEFIDMGGSWVPVRDALIAGTLRQGDKGIAEVVSRWEQLLRFAGLRLSRDLGTDVRVVRSRREAADPALLFAAQRDSLVDLGLLTGGLSIPDAVGPLNIEVNLRASSVAVFVDVDAPREGRGPTRVNWIVRQLKDAPENLRIDSFATGARSSKSELLRAVRENPGVLIEDANHELRSFRLAASSKLGTKRGTGRGAFIDSVLSTIDGFYGSVLQELRPWAPRAPQLTRSTDAPAIALAPDGASRKGPSELTTFPESPAPAAVRESVELSDPETPSVEHPEQLDEAPVVLPETPPAEMLSWDQAQDRLERERSVEDPGSSLRDEPPADPS